MSLQNDKNFIDELKLYLNETDVQTILHNLSKPLSINNNINKRTGCTKLGVPSVKIRRPLTKGSLTNYKSVILKFAKFKKRVVGQNAPINVDIMKIYEEELLSNNRTYQSIVFNIRILNNIIFRPLLSYELTNPKNVAGNNNLDNSISSFYRYNNKPQLTHEEVQRTLKYMYDHCSNRDHVMKCILIYYTGLRHCEANSLTFKDILDGWSKRKDKVLILVKKGKGNIRRNVLLFKGAPLNFFNQHFVPYLSMKFLLHLNQYDEDDHHLHKYNQITEKDILHKPIFSKSSYQSVLKEFNKALAIVVEAYSKINNDDDDDDNNNTQENRKKITKDILKGAGIHSIRADYSTRTMFNLYNYSKNNMFLTLKYVRALLGHKSDKTTDRHYLNLGFNFRNKSYFKKAKQKFNDFNKNNENIVANINSNNNFENSNLFEKLALSHGEIIHKLLGNNRKTHNICNLFNIYDHANIFSVNNEKIDKKFNPHHHHNENVNNEDSTEDEEEDDDDDNDDEEEEEEEMDISII